MALGMLFGRVMLIRLGYDIELGLPQASTIVAILNVHSSRVADLREADEIQSSPAITQERYTDSFDNTCTRLLAPQGNLRLWGSTLIEASGETDAVDWNAPQLAIEHLPTGTLQFLLSSRYCEVDRLSGLAWQLFSETPTGGARVQAICDWVHQHITFGYGFARTTKSALDVHAERQGVCRDYQHLAITLCRAMHIPARYATGYLGDIGVPLVPPMDFSAWFEVYLDNRWWAFDARNNQPRLGRILMATGRDASDVAITTSFGQADLCNFFVVSEIEEAAVPG
jgi:transglutaminase-like putative cysteine protease